MTERHQQKIFIWVPVVSCVICVIGFLANVYSQGQEMGALKKTVADLVVLVHENTVKNQEQSETLAAGRAARLAQTEKLDALIQTNTDAHKTIERKLDRLLGVPGPSALTVKPGGGA